MPREMNGGITVRKTYWCRLLGGCCTDGKKNSEWEKKLWVEKGRHYAYSHYFRELDERTETTLIFEQ